MLHVREEFDGFALGEQIVEKVHQNIFCFCLCFFGKCDLQLSRVISLNWGLFYRDKWDKGDYEGIFCSIHRRCGAGEGRNQLVFYCISRDKYALVLGGKKERS